MHFSNRKTIALIFAGILAALILCTVICPSYDSWNYSSEAGPANASEAVEKTSEFMMPASLPENNQMYAGLIITQAKNIIVQTGRKMMHLIFVSVLLLYGCIIHMKHLPADITHIITEHPEISLRIGGHAPPMYAAV